ncbi:MAG: hypothetical protein LBH64_03455 [Coriobacteriales bacterium]|jgi:cell fate regulator YaaT (PSP1 superfamily)|nr:hypothetical protein [Coriobacteriales bacterium]
MSEQQTVLQTVVAVRLRYNPKLFWFDPALSSYAEGDHVLVETERGREIGLVVNPALEVSEEQIAALKSPLKPVIRALGKEDFARIDELDERGKQAMPIFRELIEKHGLDMKPVSVEFLFSGEKAIFYFSHDGRVDFRNLVRDLASHFHIRIDMRQIGVRDEARMCGGLAHCGEELCCARLGGVFQPVSIRMAKEQDLPLNPLKISGACGRLMCCLRYEFEAYRDFKSRAPKRGALIETPIGQAKVVDFDTPREIINLRLEDGKRFAIPLSEFDCKADGDTKRPCCVSQEAIDRCATGSLLTALASFEQEQGTGQREQTGRRERSRTSASTTRALEDERAPRRPRRSGTRTTDGEQTESTPSASRPRPGQHSSGLRNAGGDAARGGGGRGAGGGGAGGGGRSRRGGRAAGGAADGEGTGTATGAGAGAGTGAGAGAGDATGAGAGDAARTAGDDSARVGNDRVRTGRHATHYKKKKRSSDRPPSRLSDRRAIADAERARQQTDEASGKASAAASENSADDLPLPPPADLRRRRRR